MAIDLSRQSFHSDSSLVEGSRMIETNSAGILSGALFGRDIIALSTDISNLPLKSPQERIDFLSEKVPDFDRNLFTVRADSVVKNEGAFNFSTEEQHDIEEIINNQFQPLHEKVTKIATAKMWFQVAAVISAIASSVFTLIGHLGLMAAASTFVTPISIVGGVCFAASFIASWYEGSKREELKEIATSLENRRQQKIMEVCRSQTLALDNFFDIFVNGKIVDEESQNPSSRSISSTGILDE